MWVKLTAMCRRNLHCLIHFTHQGITGLNNNDEIVLIGCGCGRIFYSAHQPDENA